jgi:hypothetical protein
MENINHMQDNTISHFDSNLTALSNEPPERRKDSRVETETFKIGFASSEKNQQLANVLVEKLYSSRGYDVSSQAAPTNEKIYRRTLLVYNNDDLPIGTLTMTPDGEHGLLANVLYQQELDVLRKDSRIKLLEITKFAMDRHRGNSKKVLAGLLGIAYISAKLMGSNWMVMEVNPHHVGFYQTILGFKVIGPERTCPRVNAPAVLLGLDLSYMREQIVLFRGNKNDTAAGKSLYRYFMSAQEEADIIKRMSSAV